MKKQFKCSIYLQSSVLIQFKNQQTDGCWVYSSPRQNLWRKTKLIYHFESCFFFLIKLNSLSSKYKLKRNSILYRCKKPHLKENLYCEFKYNIVLYEWKLMISHLNFNLVCLFRIFIQNQFCILFSLCSNSQFDFNDFIYFFFWRENEINFIIMFVW